MVPTNLVTATVDPGILWSTEELRWQDVLAALWSDDSALRIDVCGDAVEAVQHGHVRRYSISASLCKHCTFVLQSTGTLSYSLG